MITQQGTYQSDTSLESDTTDKNTLFNKSWVSGRRCYITRHACIYLNGPQNNDAQSTKLDLPEENRINLCKIYTMDHTGSEETLDDRTLASLLVIPKNSYTESLVMRTRTAV